jgi:flagellar biosynthesis protein FlhG
MSLTLVSGRRTQTAFTIAVTSGKGGVGKTSVATNLAVAIARLARRVALVDGDFALGNIDVRLGLHPAVHLGDVLDGACSIDDVMLPGPYGIDIVPAASGDRGFCNLDTAQWARLSDALADAARGRDFVIVDTATGVADTVIDLIGLTDYALVVTSNEPASLVDAYAVVKLLTAADRTREIGVVVNKVRDVAEADIVFRQISRAADRFLGRTLRYDGFVVDDPEIRIAAIGQVPVAGGAIDGPGGRCFRRLASRLAGAPPGPPRPGLSAGIWSIPAREVSATCPEAPRCA